MDGNDRTDGVEVTIGEIERKARGIVTVTLADGGGTGDDGRAHPLPLEALILHRIHGGATYPAAEWERIRADGALLLATRQGLELLARKQRTEQELREALGKDFLPADIDSTLARLHELGYLDDRAWAERYVASTHADGRSEAVLRRELRAHGVADEDMTDALEGRDDLDAALAAACSRVRALRSLDDATRRRRLYDFLRRRGFADGVARRAIDAAFADADAPQALEAPSRRA